MFIHRGLWLFWLTALVLCSPRAFTASPSLAVAPAAPLLPPPWPHEQSDLTPDPRITFGRLENGLRYLVMPNAKPAGRVTFFLLVEAGSYHETNDERGLAHVVEHMVFNGSRDFPGDDTIKTLQRLGLRFGPDINATTEMLQTCYRLEDLTVADNSAIPTGLKILRNFADGARFDKAAVTKERAVILAEARSRNGEARLTWDRELEFLPPTSAEYTGEEISALFDDTRIDQRIDAMGSEKIIRKATPAKLRAFYDRWYRPGRMILAAVGDLDPAAMSAQIERAFHDLKGRTPPPAEPATGQPPDFTQAAPFTFVTLIERATQIHLTAGAALPRSRLDTSARRQQDLPQRFALQLLHLRLERTASFPAEFDRALSHAIPGWTLPLLRAAVPKKHLRDAATGLIAEIRRAQQHGFTTEELELSLHSFRAHLESTQRDAANRTSPELARALAYAAARGVVLTAPADDRRLTEAALGGVTPDSCLEAVRHLWPAHHTLLALWGDLEPTDYDDAFSKAVAAAWNADYTALAEKPVDQFPHTDFGPPGKIVAQRHDGTLDATFLQFANGVRLNFKRTAFEAGQIHVRVNFGDGGLGADRRGYGLAIGAVFFGGFRDLPLESLGTVIKKAGAQLNLQVQFTENAYSFSAQLDDKSLPLGLQILTAFLAAPGFRESADPKLRAMFEPLLAATHTTTSAVADQATRVFLHGRHPASAVPTVAETRGISFAALRDFIAPQLLQSPLEITLVGDLSVDDATALVARTFGALPPRMPDDSLRAPLAYTPPKLPHHETIPFQGRNSVASVSLAWRIADAPGNQDDCRAHLLRSILDDRLRLKIRQEMGATYTPDVAVWTPGAYAPAALIMRCRIETQRKDVDRVAKAIREVAAALLRDGVTAEELERARLPLILSAEAALKSNAWWFDQLAEAQSKPQFLTGLTETPALHRALTAADLNTFARSLLTKNNSCEFHVLPQ